MFFETWKLFTTNNISSISFYRAFLRREMICEKELLDNSEENIIDICEFLRELDINDFIEILDDEYTSEVKPEDIVQFSNFNAGVVEVPLIIENEGMDLSFDELGLKLLGIREDGALKKYGENHAKLAEIFSLVQLINDRQTKVRISALGLFFNKIDIRFKNKILRLLALRNPMVKNIIINAKSGRSVYVKEAGCLSASTQIRRRNNVRKIVELILVDSNYENLLDNIEW